MSHRRHVLMAAVLLVVANAGARSLHAQSADISGTWVLNVDASDDPQEEFRRWLQGRGVPGGGAAGGGGAPGTGAGEVPAGGAGGVGGAGGAGGGGFGGGFGGGRAGGGLLAMMQRFQQGTERLVIAQNEPEVTITNAEGAANMVFTDGRVVERVDDNGGKTKVKTRWKKERLIIDVDFPPRPNPAGGTMTPSLTMTYSLDKQGRLEIATTVGIGAAIPPFTVERVYDREPPG